MKLEKFLDTLTTYVTKTHHAFDLVRQSWFGVSRNSRPAREANRQSSLTRTLARFTWRRSTGRVEAIYLNDSFVRSLGPKAQPICNITGRAYRHYVAGALILLYLPGRYRPHMPYRCRCLLDDYIRRRRGSILVALGCAEKREKEERARAVVKKRSKLTK